MPSRAFHPLAPTDVARSIAGLRSGVQDPTIAIDSDGAWVATRTPEGPATIRFSGSDPIVAESWGPGAEAALETAPEFCGAVDDPNGFDPRHDLLSRLTVRFPALRVTRTGAVTEGLLRIVPAQRVTSTEAHRGYRAMVRELGDPAPGPRELLVPPDPVIVGSLGYPAFHPWGIERTRATTMVRVARAARRLDETATMALPDAYDRITAVPGLGVWSASRIGSTALGDADAIPIGDFHIPHAVSWALAGEARGTDDRMVELLEPYRPHRGRVVMLIKAAGIHAPRYGPKAPVRSIERL